jgi:branched-chain amino acid transport system permease protein
VAGTALVTVLVHYLGVLGTLGGMPDYAPAVFTYAVYGLVLALTVLFLPHGVVPSLAEWWRRARTRSRERRASAAATAEGGHEPARA